MANTLLPSQQPSAAPAPLKFMLPFPKTGTGTKSVAAQEEDPQEFTRSWGQAAGDGFYPLGLNGQWHGGIHFDEDTGSRFNQADGVRCIADGEIIAYRVDTEPPKSCYENYEQVNAQFATSFVLVRHRLQYPYASASDAPSCVFYSLYMHLRHWKAYEDDENDEELKRPAFWEIDPDKGQVGEKAKDNAPSGPDWVDSAPPAGEKGLNLRGENNAVIGWAARGTRITLGDKLGDYRKIESIDGRVFRRDDVSEAMFKQHAKVYVKELDPIIGGPKEKDTVYIAEKKGKPGEEKLPQIKAGELVGHLGNYRRFNPEVICGATRRTVAHLEVFSPEFKKFIEECRKLEPTAPASAKNLLKIDKGAKPVYLPMYDIELDKGELVMLAKDSPKEGLLVKLVRGKFEIKKRVGELEGWNAGKQSFDGGRLLFAAVKDSNGASPMLADNFVAQNTTTQSQYPWRKVFIPDESKAVWVQRSWYESRAENSGNKNRIIENTFSHTQAWSQFPLKEGQNEVKGSVASVQVIDVKKKGNPLIGHGAKDDQGVNWLEVKYPIVEPEGVYLIKGWVSETDFDKVTKCSPWSWPAFELAAEDPLTPQDWFNRRVKKDYTPSTPLLSLLFKLLDTDGDKELTADEIHAGWKKPWLAQALSRQVVEHKSEWGLPLSEWDKLDAKMSEFAGKILRSNIRPEKIWQEEKKRIKKLVWWDKVAGNHEFPSEIKVWHVHPLGLIENFATSRPLFTVALLRLIWTDSTQMNGVPDARLQQLADELNRIDLVITKLDTPLRLSHFFAQIRREVGSKMNVYENLNYKWSSLNQKFSKFSSNPGKNLLYGRIDGNNNPPGVQVHQNADQKAIAAIAYGGRNDLGNAAWLDSNNNLLPNPENSDGWRFRGMGFKQLTGRNNYRDFRDSYQATFGEGPAPVDFEAHPEVVGNDMKYGIRAGVYFWKQNNLHTRADEGATHAAVERITDKVNYYDDVNGRQKRRTFFDEIWNAQIFADFTF